LEEDEIEAKRKKQINYLRRRGSNERRVEEKSMIKGRGIKGRKDKEKMNKKEEVDMR